MGIKKQEFYEGAALHIVARTGGGACLRYEPPFFLLNDRLVALLKYSTKGRSPWGFTFTSDEQALLRKRAAKQDLVIGLICGADGVAAVPYESYIAIAGNPQNTIHIACYRDHGEHYQVNGPNGLLARAFPTYDEVYPACAR
jgi:hypothetical protein